jgi:predicted nuclease of restriction endonuclease-like RecB superfamily
MLRKEHTLFDVRNDHVIPDRITKARHSAYPKYAEEMIAVFGDGIGKTRQELEREVERILDADPDSPLRRPKAFFKLLEDASTFDTDRGHKAWRVRKEVMDLAVGSHPLKRLGGGIWGKPEAAVKDAIAKKLGREWQDIEGSLFTDIIQYHKLLSFDGYPADELLNRYNIGQCQAALFDCIKLRVEATEQFKEILTYAKLARLLHEITRVGEGRYVFEFSGPASVLRDTQRYGTSMAKFLPSLLRCRGWKMEAQIKMGKRPVRFLLSPEDRLRPAWAEEKTAFDSSIEETFMAKWGDEPRNGWSLSRERDILWKDQHVFTPDFLLTHQDGRRVFLEIAGFWTPEYVKQKRATLAQFSKETIVLAVPDALHDQYADLGRPLVRYKGKILISAVADILARLTYSTSSASAGR